MGQPGEEKAAGDRSDPVSNYEKWKKRYTRKKEKCKSRRKQNKKPDWQIERDVITHLQQRYTQINTDEILRFSDFPLSKKTLRGLVEGQYRMPTEIQKQTIGLALQGKDILGAAKTGSGKTLAFLIPALECLYRQQWTADDGLGILIISPTRELAYQTFEVLRKVGHNHEFSAGLIIGGKDLQQESARIHRTNILICTPGRLLQHMDETSFFHASSLQMLVLDEADRILDMGFAETMNAIIENLPKKRQTLLFSATQTKSVKDLARLSLKDPEYVWVHEKAKFSTPATLEQNYVVCDLPQKINLLFSFVKTHLKKKSIVFFSSCKQVQFLFRIFCRLRPGIPILALHGKQQQMKRMEVYNDFVKKKDAVLFATDIAARGLDFPAVNWVLQFDCPEDANTYIHRVGRTARYKEGGEALLVLLPSEVKGMVRQLEEKKVPINEIKINPEKLLDVQERLEAFLAQEQEMKERAQRCFVSYLRAVYLMKNKEVFDVFKLPLPDYARSMGLAVAPRVRFLQKAQEAQALVSQPSKPPEEPGTVSDEELENFKAQLGGKTPEAQNKKEDLSSDEKEDKDNERAIGKNQSTFQFINEDDDDDEDRDLEIFTVKRRDVFGVNQGDDGEEEEEVEETSKSKLKKTEKLTKAKDAKKVLKKKFIVNKKIVFADDGEVIQQWPPAQKTSVKDEEDDEDLQSGINLEKARQRLTEEDKFDKEAYRQKIKEKHREKRLKEKAARREANKKQEEGEEDEDVAYLDHDSEDEVDLSALPDPDKYRDLEENDDQSMKEGSSDHEDSLPRKRTVGSKSKSKAVTPVSAKKRKAAPRSKESAEPLNTGLSLAEDEELVLHLLSNSR
ncbi:putative ATP-dependent RNA helicase DDX10 [Gastrophryne carolinensis]